MHAGEAGYGGTVSRANDSGGRREVIFCLTKQDVRHGILDRSSRTCGWCSRSLSLFEIHVLIQHVHHCLRTSPLQRKKADHHGGFIGMKAVPKI